MWRFFERIHRQLNLMYILWLFTFFLFKYFSQNASGKFCRQSIDELLFSHPNLIVYYCQKIISSFRLCVEGVFEWYIVAVTIRSQWSVALPSSTMDANCRKCKALLISLGLNATFRLYPTNEQNEVHYQLFPTLPRRWFSYWSTEVTLVSQLRKRNTARCFILEAV